MRTPSLALLAAGVGALALVGCSDADTTASPSPAPTTVAAPEISTSPGSTPTASPTPTRPPTVRGARHPRFVDVTDADRLGPDDRGEVDEARVRGFARAVFDWLDAHLNDLQAGGAGELNTVLHPRAPWVDDATRTALTTGLASPDVPVLTADYALRAFHDATIEYATVVLTIETERGVSSSTLLFTRNDEGNPVLTMAEVQP